MLSTVPRQVKQFAIASLTILCVPLLMAAPTFAYSSMAGSAQQQIMGCAGCNHSGGSDGCRGDGCNAQTQVQPPNSLSSRSEFVKPPEGNAIATKGLKNRPDSVEQEVQLSGEVLDVYQISSKRGLRSGVHVLLQTNGDTIEVRLGPSWYLEEQQFSLEPEDWITVEGTRTNQARVNSLMAYRITRGEQVLVLRDESGMPLWRSGPERMGAGQLLPQASP